MRAWACVPDGCRRWGVSTDDVEGELARLNHQLQERVKELTILHETARLLQNDRPLDASLLGELAALLPPAWQYPEICEGSIRYGDIVGQSAGFRPSPWMQRATFATSDGQRGVVEVVYLEEQKPLAEGPFLAEERSLIQSLADMLGTFAERQRATLALKRAEERFALLFKAAPVGIALVDTSERYLVVDINDELERLLGYARTEAIGRPPAQIGLWPDQALRDLQVTRAAEMRGVTGLELLSRAKDGRRIPLRFSAQSLTIEGSTFLLLALIDVSEQKRAETAIRDSEARLRRVIESTMLGFAFARSADIIHDANDEFFRITGIAREDVLRGRVAFGDLESPATHGRAPARTLDSIASAPPLEMDLVRTDGSTTPVLVGASRVDDAGGEHVAFLLDLTERRALEQRLQRAQRMEAVGRLAAGIAHDFNNFLSAITMSAELLREEIPELHSAAEYVTEIRNVADRAAGLTRQLLAFSRQQVMEPRVMALDVLVADLEKLIRRVVGRDVTLHIRRATDLGAIRADPSQIQQVILNLVVNARDAMESRGTLTIELAVEAHAAAFLVGDERLPAGSYVALHVIDTGAGIPADVKARIFDPFFTTKEPSRGTGLGLATVYGIVRQSGGAIDVESAPGLGARFRVLLPRVEASIEPPPERGPTDKLAGSEVILVVEDDPLVRRMIRRSLELLGYTILEAGGFQEATQLVEEYEGQLDLLLTDLVMPGGNGRILARTITEKRPGLSVVLMSGYTNDAGVRDGEAETGLAFLQKPFSSADLARRIRELLDRPDRVRG